MRAAVILGCDTRRVRDLVRLGIIGVYSKDGPRWWVSLEDVLEQRDRQNDDRLARRVAVVSDGGYSAADDVAMALTITGMEPVRCRTTLEALSTHQTQPIIILVNPRVVPPELLDEDGRMICEILAVHAPLGEECPALAPVVRWAWEKIGQRRPD